MSRLKNFQSKVELDEYTFMWQTHLFDLPYLPIGQKCFSLLGNITQANKLKKKEFLKILLDVMEDHFVFPWVLPAKRGLLSQLLESGSGCKRITLKNARKD